MNAYKDAEAYAAALVAKGYTPEGIIAFANTIIEFAYTAHSANKTPRNVSNKDRLDIIEQALSKLALMTGMNELSQHVEATYCEEGLIRRRNVVDAHRIYVAFRQDGDDDEQHINSFLDGAAWDTEYGDMSEDHAMFVEYAPVYDEHYGNPKVMTLRETIAQQMADLHYPNGYFGTTY